MKGTAAANHVRKFDYAEDVSPGTSLYPRSSVETYRSSYEDVTRMDVDTDVPSADSIPPLRPYRHAVIEPDVRPARPDEFAQLFPSMNRLSIRHDEFTTDGNMNLRVDTQAMVASRHGGVSRRQAIQLFHLRMYDLGRREFSLRRYSRDSGREVCSSKRRYESEVGPVTTDDSRRPALKRAMTTAIKTLGSPARPGGFRRVASSGGVSLFGSSRRPGSSGSSSSSSSGGDGDDELHEQFNRSLSFQDSSRAQTQRSKPRPVPTNTIKLEFSNYARVDVTRRGGSGTTGHKNNKRYDFEWWGHRYSWRRVPEKHLPGAFAAFHLVRDGNSGAPIAHIVPEVRDPYQAAADEEAGGWVPPCFFWIGDESVIGAVTDVADVIVATGLIALVDDCIKERWSRKKKSSSSSLSSSTGHKAAEGNATTPSLPRSDSSEGVSRKMSAAARNVFRRVPAFDNGSNRQHYHTYSQAMPTSPLRYISAH